MVGKKKYRVKHSGSDKRFNTILLIASTILLLLVLYPLWFIVISSFSSPDAVMSGRVFVWPVEFTTIGYEMVLKNESIIRGTANSLFLVVTTTLHVVIMNVLAAYPLSRRNFYGKKLYNIIFIIPMFIGGGLIPGYIWMSQLGLVNSLWGQIVMSGCSMGTIIVIRAFFQSNVPEELLEAAKIDGITDANYLVKIVLPLSKAVLAVQILGCAVGVWNSYVGPMIYLRNRDLWTLQLILRGILSKAQIEADSFNGTTEQLLTEMRDATAVVQYAVIVLTAFPIMVAMPFMRKHFKEGVMLGTLKG